MSKSFRLISPEILRADGMIGAFGHSLTLADGELLGRAAGTVVRAAGRRRIALCFDGRNSSPDLAAALTVGLVRTGATVLRLGRGPLPLLLFGAQDLRADAAIMVTGADEPPDHNGFKFYLGQNTLPPDQVEALLHRVARRSFASGHGIVKETPVFENYVGSLAQSADPAMQSLVVGLDTGNGAAGEVVAALTRQLPGKYALLHRTIDGGFPARRPWRPFSCMLGALRSAIRTGNCDIGFAFDALGAEMAVLDGRGRRVGSDALAAIFPDLTDADSLRLAIRLLGRIAVTGTSFTTLVDRIPDDRRSVEMSRPAQAAKRQANNRIIRVDAKIIG